MKMEERLILALDTSGTQEGEALLDRVGRACKVKVGPRLFALGGERFVRGLVDRGHRVFLDLKLHDIPNTVAQAVEVYARWGLWALTVHTAGGRGMMRAAQEAAGSLLLLGVTVLTSLEGEAWAEAHRGCALEEALRDRAALAAAAGLGGLVCSPRDLGIVRGAAPGLATVVPGIRLAGDGVQDQARVDTPGRALAQGADYLVVGRSILGAPDPAEAATRVLREMEEAGA